VDLANEKYNKEAKGTIFDIQRFSINDGPGIRTIVFIKGCPLSCKWCSNPESQLMNVEIMYNASNCINCGNCKDICPENAIDFQAEHKIDRDKCKKCGLCVEKCYYNALLKTGREVNVEELVEELKKDSIQFRRSGGGVTISGGELLTQSDFVRELLKACKAKGWHTTIETTAFGKKELIEKILPFVDLVLLDIKHINKKMHREHIGVDNYLILENAKYISENAKELIIRVPVIPNFNCDKASINDIAEFVSKLNEVERVDLLPYHNLGESKYDNLGINYEMDNKIESPKEELMEEFKKLVESYNLECSIGG
jgi:pyruvate formate lyase activating enzyme